MSSSSSSDDSGNLSKKGVLVFALFFSLTTTLLIAIFICTWLKAKKRRANIQQRQPAGNNNNAAAQANNTVTPVYSGLSKEEIAKLPRRVYRTTSDSEKHYETDQACMICLSDYQQGEKLIDLPCKHSFHKKCVVTWLESNSRCPLCSHGLSNPATPPAAHIVDVADN